MLAARAGPRPEEEEEASELGRRGKPSKSVRAARRMKRTHERDFQSGPRFDDAIERKFPAFRALQVRQVPRAHVRRQPAGNVAPELGLKLEVAVFPALNIRARRAHYKR